MSAYSYECMLGTVLVEPELKIKRPLGHQSAAVDGERGHVRSHYFLLPVHVQNGFAPGFELQVALARGAVRERVGARSPQVIDGVAVG